MGVLENGELRSIYGPKKQRDGENYIMTSNIICALHQILLG
jgi:hypothetical protein